MLRFFGTPYAVYAMCRGLHLSNGRGYYMRSINRKPLFVAFLAAMLLLCAGCNDGRAAPTPASGKAAEGHDTAIPSEITEDVETPAVTIGDIAEEDI